MSWFFFSFFFFFFQAEDGIRDLTVTGVQTCALPISTLPLLALGGPTSPRAPRAPRGGRSRFSCPPRSEEHTSELQSQSNLVCRLLLEKKKISRFPRVYVCVRRRVVAPTPSGCSLFDV